MPIDSTPPLDAARELEDAMTLLGLEAEEREAFSHLVRGGECSAGDIAKLTGLPRANAYKVLRALVGEGLVKERPGRPLTYSAQDLPASLRLYASMAAERAKSLLDLADRIPARVSVSGSSLTRPEHVSVFAGRQTIFRELQRMVHLAKEHIMLHGNTAFARRLEASNDLLFSIDQAHLRGARVKILVPEGPAAEALGAKLGGGIVSGYPPERPRVFVLCATDATLLAILPQPDDHHPLRGDDLGIKVESLALVRGILGRLGTFPETQRSRPGMPGPRRLQISRQ